MNIKVGILRGCDNCGNPIGPDEMICDVCKEKSRRRDEAERRQIERDCLVLEQAKTKPIYKSWDELPEDIAQWTKADFNPIGIQVTSLVFTSRFSSSQYFGKNIVVASVGITPPAIPPRNAPCWDDFAQALLRA